jgi:hypothetical protein
VTVCLRIEEEELYPMYRLIPRDDDKYASGVPVLLTNKQYRRVLGALKAFDAAQKLLQRKFKEGVYEIS